MYKAFKSCSFGWFNFQNLQTQTVLVKVLNVCCSTVIHIGVGKQLLKTISSFGHFCECDSCFVLWFTIPIVKGSKDMILIPFPVEYPICHIMFKRPLQLMVILTFHEIYRHRHMCAFANTKSISINTQAQLVSSWCHVEWLAIPYVTISLVL